MAISYGNDAQAIGTVGYRIIGRLLAERHSRGQILDIACSVGSSTALLREQLPDADVLGCDLNEVLIRNARVAYPNCRFEVMDVRKLPPDWQFDAIVSGHTIEHLNESDQRTCLAEVLRVLRPGGTFAVSTPDVDVLKAQGTAGTQPDHVREITKHELIDLVRGAGFVVECVYGQGMFRGASLARRALNFLKRFDILHLRRFVSKRFVDSVDQKTQPVDPDFTVRPLGERETALNLIVVARKPN